MKAGTTFLLKNRGIDTHLWMIVSDPEIDPRRVLLLSLTSYRDGKEDVCLIERGQHPFVRHTTCVAYDIAKVVTLDQLTAFRDSGQLEIQPPASEELLARIRSGISLSRRIETQYVDLMLEQGLLD